MGIFALPTKAQNESRSVAPARAGLTLPALPALPALQALQAKRKRVFRRGEKVSFNSILLGGQRMGQSRSSKYELPLERYLK